MPNLEFELAQLHRADSHIQLAERAAARLRSAIEAQRGTASDLSLPSRSLAAAVDMLEALREHRGLIERVIEDVRAGRLPAT